MNVEELTYLGAQGAGAAVGAWIGLSEGGVGAGMGGLVVGLFVGWALCFFPFFLARVFDAKKRERLAQFAWRLGFSAPLIAPLLMWWLW
ncbi:MAG: hypothetical protein ACSHYB_14370 [Roseibacillus sp.]